MRGPHNIWRLVQTGATFERSGAMSVAMDALETPKPIRIPIRFLVWPIQFLGLKGEKKYPPVLRALIALGPAYIKFGQLLSTRPDVVGNGLANELRILQDALPAFDQKDSIKAIENDLNIKVHEVFLDFEKPVAAASLAQVHKATVKSTKQSVAVKVLRPGIEKAFLRDIDAFYFIARFIELLSPASRRLKPLEVIKYFEGIVRAEIDLRMESAAAAEFHSNTKDDENFKVPKVVWDLSSKRVMTTEWVDGIPVGDVDLLKSKNIDLKKLSELIIQSFLNNALRDGFFHADMHQGNLFIDNNGRIIPIDFGIMGRINKLDRRYLAEILYGFIQRDYKKVAQVHIVAGLVPQNVQVDELAQALRSIGEPIFGQSVKDISGGKLLKQLFDVTAKFNMQTQPQLLLLQKTMVVVEGVARSLNPETNIWDTSKPVLEKWLKETKDQFQKQIEKFIGGLASTK